MTSIDTSWPVKIRCKSFEVKFNKYMNWNVIPYNKYDHLDRHLAIDAKQNEDYYP